MLVDLTGAVELGAHVTLDAIKHHKHMILMNAELDATVGPILKTYADAEGVIVSACDGDQPGVQINLSRFVKGLGLIPRVLGNIKGLQDEYRNPTTQAGFAAQWGQNPAMVTSFADGSKVSFEQAIVANALRAHGPPPRHARPGPRRSRRRADHQVRHRRAARARRRRRLRRQGQARARACSASPSTPTRSSATT